MENGITLAEFARMIGIDMPESDDEPSWEECEDWRDEDNGEDDV